MARKGLYDDMRSQLALWEVGCFDRACSLWDMLMRSCTERDLGMKLTALDGLLGQLGAWRELLREREGM